MVFQFDREKKLKDEGIGGLQGVLGQIKPSEFQVIIFIFPDMMRMIIIYISCWCDVCLSVTFRHHADLYILLMWRLTWRLPLPWIGKLSRKAPELSPLKKPTQNYISLQNYSKAQRSNPTDDKWLMTDDNDKAGQVQSELSAVGRHRTLWWWWWWCR